MADPLAGKREQINRGELNSLQWRDDGNGCPVSVGQVYELRACWIQISKVVSRKVGSGFVWRATFDRRWKDMGRLWLLDRKGDYTEDPDQAMRAQDDPDASTLDRVDPDDRSDEHRNNGEPPEPEAIPPAEVAELPSSVAARVRHAEIHRADVDRRMNSSLIAQIRRARLSAQEADRVRATLQEVQTRRDRAA